jgi:hypothetical protein
VPEDPDPGAGLLHGPTETRARELVQAFQHGLGADEVATTPAMRRRDLTIARQLAAVGASPGEAEAYAREASMTPRRLSPVDLRAFERERASWLGRRHTGVGASLLARVVNGRIPE